MTIDSVKRLQAAARHPYMDNTCKVNVFDVAEVTDHIQTLTAELATLREALSRTDWCPMDTAPKDGTKILAYRGPEYGTPADMWVVWWDEDWNEWFIASGVFVRGLTRWRLLPPED